MLGSFREKSPWVEDFLNEQREGRPGADGLKKLNKLLDLSGQARYSPKVLCFF